VPRPAPMPRQRPRPSREEILAARKNRRLRFGLYVASIGWAAAVAILILLRWDDPFQADLPLVGALLVPGVVAGLLAGRRAWMLYGGTAVVCVVFAALLPPFLTVIVTCGAVLLLGYVLHLIRCSIEGRSVSEPLPRDADDPRSRGASAAQSGMLRTRKATIADASPTGEEIGEPRIPYR